MMNFFQNLKHVTKFGRLSMLTLVGWLLLTVLAACGDPSPTATPLPLPKPTEGPPDPRVIAKQAADKIQTLNSLHFLVDIKSGEVEITNGITFQQADGDFSKPDKFRAKLKVTAGPVKVNAETVGMDNKQWLLLSGLSNSWTTLPANVGFKPDVLFDPNVGLGAIVNKVKDLKLVGTEKLKVKDNDDKDVEVDTYHLNGVVTGPDIKPITASTLGKTDVDFDIWVSTADSLVRQVVFKEKSTDPKASNWQLNFWKFNKPVEIKSPV